MSRVAVEPPAVSGRRSVQPGPVPVRLEDLRLVRQANVASPRHDTNETNETNVGARKPETKTGMVRHNGQRLAGAVRMARGRCELKLAESRNAKLACTHSRPGAVHSPHPWVWQRRCEGNGREKQPERKRETHLALRGVGDTRDHAVQLVTHGLGSDTGSGRLEVLRRPTMGSEQKVKCRRKCSQSGHQDEVCRVSAVMNC
jgi:hypothetical protein